MSLPIVFVPGMWDDGDDNFVLLEREVASRGLPTEVCRYPHNGLLDQRSKKKRVENARALIAHIGGRRVHVAGHSNGCGVIYEAMLLDQSFARCFMFGAALDSDIVFPAGCAERINVINNPRDRALTLGRLMWRHPYGGLGKDGYQGPFNPIVHSISALVEGTVDRNEHSHYGKDPKWRAHWTDYLVERCQSTTLNISRDYVLGNPICEITGDALDEPVYGGSMSEALEEALAIVRAGEAATANV